MGITPQSRQSRDEGGEGGSIARIERDVQEDTLAIQRAERLGHERALEGETVSALSTLRAFGRFRRAGLDRLLADVSKVGQNLVHDSPIFLGHTDRSTDLLGRGRRNDVLLRDFSHDRHVLSLAFLSAVAQGRDSLGCEPSSRKPYPLYTPREIVNRGWRR